MTDRNIQHIFSDMDGTLLNGVGRVSERNARCIRRSQIPLTLVSARAPMEMKEALEALNLTGPQVAFNGGLIYEYIDQEIHPLHVEIIHRNRARQILQEVRAHFPQVSLSYYDMKHWYCDTIDRGIRYEDELTGQAPTQIFAEQDFLAARENTFKIMMICFEEAEMQDLQTYLAGLDLNDVTILRSGPYHLEITSQKAKKSAGIAYICRKKGLNQAHTAAFGDGHNDIPMLEMVGYPIVMANASPDVKAHAWKVTKSNDQGGVGLGIHRYLLED